MIFLINGSFQQSGDRKEAEREDRSLTVAALHTHF